MTAVPEADDPDVLRHGGRELLSLALMRARNRTLQWLAAFESHGARAAGCEDAERFSPPQWLAGHAGWFQDWWIARHVQRARGAAADPQGPGWRRSSPTPTAGGTRRPARAPRAGRSTCPKARRCASG